MRILFITSNRVGDAVLSTGLLAHLLEENPGARVTVVCGPAAAGLFNGVPGLEQVITLEKKALSAHWLEMWIKAVWRFWGMVIDLRNAPLSAALFSRRTFHLGRAAKRDRHRVLALASVLGLEDNPPSPKLWPRPEDDAQAKALLPEGAPVLAVGPSANWAGKIWPSGRFAELISRLTAPGAMMAGARVAVAAHESERHLAEPLLKALGDLPHDTTTIDLIGTHSLACLYACFKRAAFYVGNDSGLMHVAAASGVPTLGLFGPSNEDHYSPWGPNGRAVRSVEPCAGIFPEGYDFTVSPTLMGGLSVDMAEQGALALWSDIASSRKGPQTS